MFVGSQIVYDKYKAEVLGFLLIKEGKNGEGLTVYDVLYPKQTVQGAHCELDISGLTPEEIPLDLMPKIKGWFHSHHNMGTFYSGEDNDTLDSWVSGKKYAIGIVLSFPNKMKAWIQYGKPLKTAKISLDVNIVYSAEDELKKELTEHLEKQVLVKKKKAKKKLKTAQKPLTVKGVNQLLHEAKLKPIYDCMSMQELPNYVNKDCIHLDKTYKDDIVCDLTNFPPYCLNCPLKAKSHEATLESVEDKDIQYYVLEPSTVNLNCKNLKVFIESKGVLRYTSILKKQLKRSKTVYSFVCANIHGEIADCRECSKIKKNIRQHKKHTQQNQTLCLECEKPFNPDFMIQINNKEYTITPYCRACCWELGLVVIEEPKTPILTCCSMCNKMFNAADFKIKLKKESKQEHDSFMCRKCAKDSDFIIIEKNGIATPPPQGRTEYKMLLQNEKIFVFTYCHGIRNKVLCEFNVTYEELEKRISQTQKPVLIHSWQCEKHADCRAKGKEGCLLKKHFWRINQDETINRIKV